MNILPNNDFKRWLKDPGLGILLLLFSNPKVIYSILVSNQHNKPLADAKHKDPSADTQNVKQQQPPAENLTKKKALK